MKPRKKSPGHRALKNAGRVTLPAAGDALRRKWADPEWREALLAKRRAVAEQRAQEGNPINKSRFGIPDGMRREEADAVWAASRQRAKEDMEALKNAGVLDGADAKAEEALQAALEVMRSPLKQETRLAAARLVLDFTKSKPVARSEVTVSTAEEWLKQVTEDNDSDAREGTEDA